MNTDPYRRRVKDVLSRDIVTIHADATIHEALSLMVQNRVSALPVVDKRGGCSGIVSATDMMDLSLELDEGLSGFGRSSDASHQWLLERLAEHDMYRRSVQDVMTATVATVHLESLLTVAAREMLRHRVHRLPVVENHDRLVGIISTMDLLRAFVDGAPEG